MTYCVQPFINVRIDSGPDFKPCCHYKQSIPAKALNEYLESPQLKELQTQLLSNNPLPVGCQVCRIQENKGQISFRQRYNEFFESTTTADITHIEVLVNNTCNLKCFMCDPAYSTALGKERQSLGWISSYPVTNHSNEVAVAIKQLPNLKTVSFIGGEFFFAKDTIPLLEMAIEHDLKINIATNATVLLPTHIELLKKAKAIDIQVSLDGIGESYDFMRYPATWEVVRRNILTLKRILPGQTVHVHAIAQPLNIQYIAPLMSWCNENMIKIRVINLQAPSWLEWRILKEDEKKILSDLLDQHCANYRLTLQQKETLLQFRPTLAMIQYNEDYRNEFINKMSSIMRHRNIEHSTILNHFGVLLALAQELIEKT
jgi:sulfatase maturation enzyme AslB (radical SAM superfamily)